MSLFPLIATTKATCNPATAKRQPVRLSSVSTYLESGLMWSPKDAPWLAGFEAELLGFPGARHDDQVDSLSQYFGWVRDRPTVMFNQRPFFPRFPPREAFERRPTTRSTARKWPDAERVPAKRTEAAQPAGQDDEGPPGL